MSWLALIRAFKPSPLADRDRHGMAGRGPSVGSLQGTIQKNCHVVGHKVEERCTHGADGTSRERRCQSYGLDGRVQSDNGGLWSGRDATVLGKARRTCIRLPGTSLPMEMSYPRFSGEVECCILRTQIAHVCGPVFGTVAAICKPVSRGDPE